jgi:hypothetical protein
MRVSLSRFQKATGALEFHPKDVVTDLRKEPKEISGNRELFPWNLHVHRDVSKVRLSRRGEK